MNLIVEHSGADNEITIIKLNRPEMLHAFTTEMAEQLLTVLNEVKNDSTVRVVILSSTTEKAFCSGADLKERKHMTDEQWKQQHELFERMFYTLEDLPHPTIAAVNGYALAGGFELALCCDMIVAGTSAMFGLPEVNRGIMPGCGGARLLPKRIPLHIAKEWLFTGRKISAQLADHAGLLNAVVSPKKVIETALLLAKSITKNAPLGVQGTKRMANATFALEAEVARNLEIQIYNEVIASHDRLEGVNAFNEKREPNFMGK